MAVGLAATSSGIEAHRLFCSECVRAALAPSCRSTAEVAELCRVSPRISKCSCLRLSRLRSRQGGSQGVLYRLRSEGFELKTLEINGTLPGSNCSQSAWAYSDEHGRFVPSHLTHKERDLCLDSIAELSVKARRPPTATTGAPGCF